MNRGEDQTKASEATLRAALDLPGSLRGGEGWTIRPPQAGGDRDVPAFSIRAGCPVEKPGQPSTHPEVAKATAGRRVGCPSSWLLLLGQARRSNSLSGRRAKPSPNGRDTASDTQQQQSTPQPRTAPQPSTPSSTPSPRPLIRRRHRINHRRRLVRIHQWRWRRLRHRRNLRRFGQRRRVRRRRARRLHRVRRRSRHVPRPGHARPGKRRRCVQRGPCVARNADVRIADVENQAHKDGIPAHSGINASSWWPAPAKKRSTRVPASKPHRQAASGSDWSGPDCSDWATAASWPARWPRTPGWSCPAACRGRPCCGNRRLPGERWKERRSHKR